MLSAEARAGVSSSDGIAMSRFHASYRLSAWIALGAGLLLGLLFVLKAWRGMPTEQLTRDPNALFDAPLYVGFLSQAGIFFWAAAAALCFFTALLIARDDLQKEERYFLVSSGLLTLMLGLDDVFLLHEQFFPFIGIPENVVYAVYGGITLLLLIRFHSLILHTQFPLLAAALALFGISMSLDCLQLEGLDIFLFEDGAKLVGILCWLAYFSHATYDMVFSCFSVRHSLPHNKSKAVASYRTRGMTASPMAMEAKAG